MKKNINHITVAVFGGSGFMGENLCMHLKKETGYKVLLFDKKAPSHLFYDDVFLGDMLDEREIMSTLEGVDVVYNFAGWQDLETARNHPVETVNQNVLATTILLNACVKNNVKHYIHASSLYIYSSKGSFYGVTKLSAEMIIKEFQKEFDLSYTLLRFGSVYGPGSKDGNTIHDLIKQAVICGKISYWGTGNELRKYIHIDDACRAAISVLNMKYKNQSVLVTGYEDVRVKDLMAMLNEIMSGTLDIHFEKDSRTNYHYNITPYEFRTEMSKNLILDSYVDLGQGLLDMICLMKKEESKLTNSSFLEE